MHAESVYLFRHALLRDAAYQLQLPGARAQLHALAFAVIEELCGGRAPATKRDESGELTFEPHSTDSAAHELADHARFARTLGRQAGRRAEFESMLAAQVMYLPRAAAYAEERFQLELSTRLWKEHAELVSGAEQAASLRRAAVVLFRAGRTRFAEPLLERAVALFRGAGLPRREGVALGNLASVYQDIGRLEKATHCFVRALALHRRAGDRRR